MELRTLGHTDIAISPIIMGTWQAGKSMWVGIKDEETVEALRAAPWSLPARHGDVQNGPGWTARVTQ